MMTILVTGGAGFIGSHIIDRLLSLGHNIICADNFDPFYNESVKRNNLACARLNPRFCLNKIDIRDKDSLEQCFNSSKVDLVIHLAAKAGVRPSIENPAGYYSTNVEGTLTLLEVMKANKVNKLIFASSSSVYGNNKKVPFSETDNVDSPISPYAASKKAGELLCYNYHHLYGFEVFCFRFFTVYGPRQRPDLAIHKFTKLIQDNLPIPFYGDGSNSRDYTYIDDIVSGIEKAVKQLKGYEIINLGESQTISLSKVVSTIEAVMNKKAIIQKLPTQPGDLPFTCADITKARKMLGYNPQWEFEKGVCEFVKWHNCQKI